MKRSILLNLAVLFGTFLFFQLFWWYEMGFNTFLFTAFIITILWGLHTDQMRHRSSLLVAAATLLTSLWVVAGNNTFSKVWYWILLVTLGGLLQARELRFLFFACVLGLLHAFKSPINFYQHSRHNVGATSSWTVLLKYFKLAIIPFFIVFLFYQLYLSANLQFARHSHALFNHFGAWFQFNHKLEIVFCSIGFMVCGMLLYHRKYAFFSHIEKQFPDTLQRHRKNVTSFKLPHKNLALKREWQMATLTLVVLNVLLLLVNALDIYYVWWEAKKVVSSELSNYVHEGTYLLIFSILLAAAVLLWFFRKNLNFYPPQTWLRRLAYIWIMQNIFLTYSVAVRGWRYVEHFGLTHKRIGVFVFLTLVLAGLYFLYQKVKHRRNFSYVARRVSWSVWVIFTIVAGINWDVLITRYNLHAAATANVPFDAPYHLGSMSTDNLFLLTAAKEQRTNTEIYIDKSSDHWLSSRVKRYKINVANQHWFEWNYAD